jgi:fibronectin-binding autotransporter adhesin
MKSTHVLATSAVTSLALAPLAMAATVTYTSGTITETSTVWQDSGGNPSTKLTGAADVNVISLSPAANVAATGPINFGQSTLQVTNVTGFQNTASGAGSRTAVSFSGGAVEVLGSSTINFGGTSTASGNAVNRLNVAGDFTKKGTGSIVFSSHTTGGGTAYGGTLTIDAGTVAVVNTQALANTAQFILTSSSSRLSYGSLMNSNGLTGSWSATAGEIDLSYNSTNPGTVTLSQNSNTVVAATVVGTSTNTGVRTLVKGGTGTLTLSATNTYVQPTSITGGTLNVTGSLGNTAISVDSNGTLAGNGSIGSTTSVAVSGKLNVGDATVTNSTGKLDFTSGTVTVDLSGVSSGGLLFTLDAPTTAGVTYDTVSTAGLLNVGTLDPSDFTFTTLAGFVPDTYTLFSAGSLLGSVDPTPFTLGGQEMMLALSNSGTSVLLTPVPEPGGAALLAAVGIAMLPRRRAN